MSIDLSKKPDGATHWAEDQRCYSTGGVQFYRNIDGAWSYWGEALGSGWRQCLKPCKAVSEIVRPKSAEWNGEGLPPVGTACERNYGGEWKKTIVCGHSPDGQSWAAFYDEDKAGWLGATGFRPIRTPEQIAADERESKAKEMYLSVYFAEPAEGWDRIPETIRETFRKAIDSGWKKVLP